jgi:hypothetical protein
VSLYGDTMGATIIITPLLKDMNNKDYDYRVHCDKCGVRTFHMKTLLTQISHSGTILLSS